jgi:hypothetical protein
VESKFRAMGDRKLQNIHEMEIDELIFGVIVGEVSAKVPGFFSSLSPNFLNPAFLDSPDRTPAKPLNN